MEFLEPRPGLVHSRRGQFQLFRGRTVCAEAFVQYSAKLLRARSLDLPVEFLTRLARGVGAGSRIRFRHPF